MVMCTYCDGDGCSECNNGSFVLLECPRDAVGRDVHRAVNLCAMADKGFLPAAGGMLDQSEWFTQIYHVMTNELNDIEEAEAEEARRKSKANNGR